MSGSLPSISRAARRLVSSSNSFGAKSILTSSFHTSIRPLSHTKVLPRAQVVSSTCRQARSFSSSNARPNVQKAKLYNRTGPFSLRSAILFVSVGACMVFYFRYEKARLERKRIVEMSKGYGKPKVGGPFTLKDTEGNDATEKILLGKYSMIYFGFSHCPDICPDELDKMGLAIDIIQEKAPNCLQSIFISCDPNRDTPEVLRAYLDEFHPSIKGLVGTWEQTKDVCKQYRVYFSTPPELKPGEEDYLVDHSIYFYVMDPEGDFVECIGRQDTPESAAAIVLDHIKDWTKEKKPIDRTPLPYIVEQNLAKEQAAKEMAAKGKA